MPGRLGQQRGAGRGGGLSGGSSPRVPFSDQDSRGHRAPSTRACSPPCTEPLRAEGTKHYLDVSSEEPGRVWGSDISGLKLCWGMVLTLSPIWVWEDEVFLKVAFN